MANKIKEQVIITGHVVAIIGMTIGAIVAHTWIVSFL